MLGGVSKGADFTQMVAALTDSVKDVVIFGQDQAIMRLLVCSLPSAETLAEAVRMACQLAPMGSCVLFSPACASFDAFDNFVHRGNVFKSLVDTL